MADIGHRETDILLSDMEAKIMNIYADAAQGVQDKLDDYMRRFEVKDEIWQKRVASGKATQAEYTQWRTGQIMMGQRWEEMRDTLSNDLWNANDIARSVVNGYMPGVYSLNHDYATFAVEKGSRLDTSYTLYDRQTAERLLREEKILPDPGTQMKRRIAKDKDIAWQKGQIQSVTLQGILQGESIPNLSKRIAETLGESNHKSTIRYARTACTAAENAGRLDAYKRAEEMGIKMQQTWVATLDNRTRHEHRQLDGQTVGVDEPFVVDGEKIRYPGDPLAAPGLIWNCRCTTIAQIKGYERDISDTSLRNDDRLKDESYDKWREGHGISIPITHQEEMSEKMRDYYIRKYYGGGYEKKETSASDFGNAKGLTDEHKKGMQKVLDASAHDEAKQIYSQYADQLVCVNGDTKKGAYFSARDGGVTMNLQRSAQGNGYQTPYELSFHEFGHMVDWLAGGKDGRNYLSSQPEDGVRLMSVIKSDYKDFKKAIGAKNVNDVISILKSEDMDKRTCGNISDILESCTGKSYPLGIGHGVSYHKRDGATEREFFAEVISSAACNEASYQQMVRLFPNAVNMVWDKVGRVLG